MKAGRELDALIAEKVMGWSKLSTERIIETGWDLYGTVNGDGDFLVPNYSTDIAAAWEVVEKLKDETMSVSIFTTHVHGPEETEILIDGVEMCRGDFSIPHAICLGALKAIGDI